MTGKATDFGEETAVRELFRFADKQFGGLDILINSAGIVLMVLRMPERTLISPVEARPSEPKN